VQSGQPDVRERDLGAVFELVDEQEVADEDLGVSFYKDETLDLADLMREQFYLALPMKPLCREDCRGLCSVCGGNRNVTACACPEPATASRWAALKGLADRLPR